MKRAMMYVAGWVGVAFVGTLALARTSRAGYESAEYTLLESDGAFEIRDYPDLLLAATDSTLDAQGRDGSFMRLFQYISGANEAEQAIAMTTPVFMEGDLDKSGVSMGFVMPKEVAANGAPGPRGDGVQLRERKGGRFAVIRFAGKLDSKLAKELQRPNKGNSLYVLDEPTTGLHPADTEKLIAQLQDLVETGNAERTDPLRQVGQDVNLGGTVTRRFIKLDRDPAKRAGRSLSVGDLKGLFVDRTGFTFSDPLALPFELEGNVGMLANDELGLLRCDGEQERNGAEVAIGDPQIARLDRFQKLWQQGSFRRVAVFARQNINR